jgi:hypothetical protein
MVIQLDGLRDDIGNARDFELQPIREDLAEIRSTLEDMRVNLDRRDDSRTDDPPTVVGQLGRMSATLDTIESTAATIEASLGRLETSVESVAGHFAPDLFEE